MPTTPFVLTLSGPDRVGIVEEVTGRLLDLGGNVETSRMVRLGGAFAMLMQVTMPADRFAGLDAALAKLTGEGYTIATSTDARGGGASARPGWSAYRIGVEGADHEGIIHEVSRYLSDRGINIESAESECVAASTSGVPLFSMTAEVAVPPTGAGSGWESGLTELGGRLNLDITVTPVQVG